MSMLRKTPALPVNDTDKALVLHSSAFRVSQPPAPPASPPAPSTGGELDLIDSLQRRWWLALGVFALIVGLGTVWSLRNTKPIYQAETTIYVPPDLAKGTGESGMDLSYPTFVNQQIMTVLHYNTLSDAIQQLAKKGVAWRLRGETEHQAVDRLKSALDVQRVPESYEITIQMTGSDPRVAALIANTVAESFLELGSRPDASGGVDRGAALLAEKESLSKELQRQLELRGQLAESLQIANPSKGATLPDDQALGQMRQALAVAHNRRIEAEERLAAGQSTLAADAEQIASNDPAARTMTSNLLQRQFELRERIKTMLPSHPVRKEAEVELASIDAELQKGPGINLPKVTAQLMAKLRAQAEEARRIEADLSKEIALEAANIPNISRNMAKVELVNGEITRIQERLMRVEVKMEEIGLRSTEGGAMRIFSAAQPPTAPQKSQRTKALGVVFALGLLMALGLPALLDLSDSRIHDPATIERILGFPIVGMTIERTPKTEQFADEHLRRLVAGIERGIAEGARNVLLVGLKQPVTPSILKDISRQLSDHKINVTVRAGRRRIDADLRSSRDARLVGPGALLSSDLEDCDIVLMDAPALVFSAEAERMAAEADMTLVVVQAGNNTRPDLVRGARLLERLNVPAVGVILQDVKVERAGRSLRRDLKEYLAMQRQFSTVAKWDGQAFV